jgi:hypothetical protein
MESHNKYAKIGLKALRRAAFKVAEDARRNNYKIPIWRDGHIVHEIPEDTKEQKEQIDSDCYDQGGDLFIMGD